MRRFLAGCFLALAFAAAYLPASAQEIVAAGPKPRIFLAGKLIGADFNSTADQAITITGTSKYVLYSITVTNCSATLSTAKGYFYAAASKASPFFNGLTTTVFTGLTGVANQSQTFGGTGGTGGGANGGSSFTYTAGTTIYLSLTTAQGSAVTCDIYAYGEDYS